MLGFIASVVAGFVTPYLEGPVARPIVAQLSKYITLEAAETRLIAFIVALLGAGVASALLNSATAFWVVVGATLGYFGARLVAAARAALDARRNS